MKDTLRLLPFHLRMLPCAVTIAYPFGRSTGLRTCIRPCKQEPQLDTADKGKPVTRIKPLSGRSGTQTQHVVPTYLPLDRHPPTL
jgi:hypothetical protein